MEWHPHVTVATLVENDGKFLFVEEIKHGRKVLNQPAGHLEENESLIEAALRETLEETQWRVEILGVVGVGLYKAPANGVTYHRTSFFARPIAFCPEQKLDIDIEQAIWLTPDELRERRGQLRSPLVLECLERYLQGQRHPLSMIY
ncbi:NUDIX hydrolase [Zhongshania sp.]|jgi:ADP-ribose pyrophosphatase YjhB (NUDIX family)|uniref:NUDIX hydrolase n=1 Tax=Zhongshania sp. TaxID=1971902 RepID=UPI001B699C86|nr:NUDIX hydrolase [Zhongshania sp.]MBQ0796302.1 NUDIX hydrolase [Zhongshania sp.]|tara:strand:- start:9422 stop:9859 length:438 start_codon:yes stop_codon:yes gene_type:complete